MSTELFVRKLFPQDQVAIAIAASGAPAHQFAANAAALFEAGREKMSDRELAEGAQENQAMIHRIRTPFSVQELAAAWQWIDQKWGSFERMEAAYAAAKELIVGQHDG